MPKYWFIYQAACYTVLITALITESWLLVLAIAVLGVVYLMTA